MPRCENNSEPCVAAHHQVVRFSGLLKWEHLVDRPYAVEHTEGECILRIHRRPAGPAHDGLASTDEMSGHHWNRVSSRTQYDQLAVDAQATQDHCHGLATRGRRED